MRLLALHAVILLLASDICAAEPRRYIPPPLELPSDAVWIVVTRGDTLSSIARRHGTSVKALKEVNNLVTDLIKVGQRLRLPVKPSAPDAKAPPDP